MDNWHPLLNACLNATSGALLIAAFVAIRAGERERHKKLMLSALAVSAVFLVSYLVRVYFGGTHKFPHGGVLKIVYLTILFSHMLLAAVVPFGAIAAVWLALKGRFATHKRVVKFLFPSWVYVSITGVTIYIMLYHL